MIPDWFANLLYLRLRGSRLTLEVAINPIPTMTMTVEIPVVFSPRISPSNIKMAAVSAIAIPIIHCVKNTLFRLLLIPSRFSSFCLLQTNSAKTTSTTATTIIVMSTIASIFNTSNYRLSTILRFSSVGCQVDGISGGRLVGYGLCLLVAAGGFEPPTKGL